MFTATDNGAATECVVFKTIVYTDDLKTTVFTNSPILVASSGSDWTFSDFTSIDTTTSQGITLYIDAYFVWRETADIAANTVSGG